MRFDGFSFVFTHYDLYSGINFDGWPNPETGEIAPWARCWIVQLNSYTEVSPSGTGVKVWVRGTLPAAVKYHAAAHNGVEIYSKQRYFCITGEHVANMPTTINDVQTELTRLGAVLTRAHRRKKRPTKAAQPIAPTLPRAGPGERGARRLSARETIDRANYENNLGELLINHSATLGNDKGSERNYSRFAADSHAHAITYNWTFADLREKA